MKAITQELESLVQFVRAHSPFYRDLYAHLPKKIDSLNSIPVIEQNHFWRANRISENRLLTGAITDGLILKSGGTTGEPKFSVFSRDEWNRFTLKFAQKLALNGLETGDRIANLFYVGDLYGSFIFTHKVLEQCPTRVLQLPIAGTVSSESIVKAMDDYQATVMAGLPTTLTAVVDEIERTQKKLPIKRILFAGEPMQKSQRERMAALFPGVQIRSIGYASNDAGLLGYADLSCAPNEFRSYDGDAIYEILDESTHEPITEVGKEGKAVITDLHRRLMPVIRYPAGDRAMWVEKEGSADRKFLLLGRSEESIRVASLTFHFDEVQAVLEKFSEALGAFQFQMMVSHLAGKDELTLRLSSVTALPSWEALSARILASIHEQNPIFHQFVTAAKIHPLQLERVNTSQLQTNPRTGKLKRVIDARLK